MADTLKPSLQENVITFLCHHNEIGKIIANIVTPDLFEGDYRVIAERAVKHWKLYNQAPGVHTTDLVDDIVRDPHNRKRVVFQSVLTRMLQLSESASLDPKYTLDELKKFVRMQRIKAGILRSAEQINARQENAIEDIELLWNDLIRQQDVIFDPGMSLLDYERMFAFHEQRSIEFSTGIRELDKRRIVPSRAAVSLFIARTGAGKTWWLIQNGWQALLQRKKVVHLTLEIPEEVIITRYYQTAFGVPTHVADEIKASVLRFTHDGKLDKVSLLARNLVPEFPAILHRDAPMELEERIQHMGQKMANIRVKAFPMSSLTVPQLRAYLDNLETVERFTPDMLLLDYIGVVNTDVKNLRLTLGRWFQEFKGICAERNVAGAVAQQTSKLGANVDIVKMTHIAEDWSLTNTADQIIVFSQTGAEHQHGLARLYVAKARLEKDQFGVLITNNYLTGQFCIQSAYLDKRYFKTMMPKDEDSDDDEEDEYGSE